jgi:WD40 repeat protein
MSGWSKNCKEECIMLYSCQFDSGLASANMARFDRSGSLVYCACEDGTVKVYNTVSKEREAELRGHEDSVLDLCFDSGKEGYLITASADQTFRVWQ